MKLLFDASLLLDPLENWSVYGVEDWPCPRTVLVLVEEVIPTRPTTLFHYLFLFAYHYVSLARSVFLTLSSFSFFSFLSVPIFLYLYLSSVFFSLFPFFSLSVLSFFLAFFFSLSLSSLCTSPFLLSSPLPHPTFFVFPSLLLEERLLRSSPCSLPHTLSAITSSSLFPLPLFHSPSSSPPTPFPLSLHLPVYHTYLSTHQKVG